MNLPLGSGDQTPGAAPKEPVVAHSIVETIAVFVRRRAIQLDRSRTPEVLTEEALVRTLVCAAVMLGIGGLIWIAAVLLAGYDG